jgi:hypothetical protein
MNGGIQLLNQNIPNGNGFFPFNTVNLGTEADVKLNEDQYEVYVNENFVGHKTLKTEGEKLSDIDAFLRTQELSDFSSSLDGDHYMIQTNEQDSDITTALNVYLNNR